MKRAILTALFLAFTLLGFGQVSERLQSQMQTDPNQLLWVSIEFPRFTDMVALRSYFQTEQIPSSERLKLINQLLMNEAQEAQASAINILQSGIGEVFSYQSFYAVNRIIAKVDVNVIRALSTLTEIQAIDLATGEIEFFEPVSLSNPNPQKTAGLTGPEPGLIAINSPAMWNLGYTGRGRKVYIYDTGVWRTHPAFRNRYLGNFKPENEAWYGYFNNEANGSIGDHGTHVLGTVGGLDTATSDTIGSAFGAYWMACDLINSSSAADLPPQVELIAAFEWALNPDGDTSTTDDVPDVINNSWRWYDPTDTNECNGFIPQLMTTIEMAGIANVFSGGNTGPSNVGVAAPQRINTTEINTFTVGAVNANVSYPYPIAAFSTRGPTQCGGTGSLQLYPEVVAPGQSVRSSVGTDDYDFYNGTSMASPHVSGALLLLKEAFPTLSGDDLIYALYTSAIDLGPAGEDNTFGNGLIDVFAAYQYLAQTHTPTNPNTVGWDVAVKDVSQPSFSDITCDSLYNPAIRVMNLGSNAIDSVELSVFKNGMPAFAKTAIAAPGLTNYGDVVLLNTQFQFPLTAGENTWSFKVEIGHLEYDLVNNERFVRFRKLDKGSLPLLEDFEGGMDSTKWLIDNPDYSTTWDTTNVTGWTGNQSAALLNHSNYAPAQNQKDGLWTKTIKMPSIVPIGGQIGLGFHLAYQYRGIGVLADTMRVMISEDCGKTFTTLYEEHGQALATTSNTGKFFVPQSGADWRREHLDLTNYTGKDVVINFETTNRNGNNLYLDNISVYVGTVDPFNIMEELQNGFKIYPNPTKNVLVLELLGDTKATNGQILDLSGKVVKTFEVDGARNSIKLDQIASGSYLIQVTIEGANRVQRFVKL